MVKRLNLFGKLLHVFTAFFPIYIFWAYFSSTKVTSWSIKNIFQIEYSLFIVLALFSISSIFIFYKILLKKPKIPNEQFNIKDTSKKSAYIRYMIGSLSPFILFITKFINNNQISNTSAILGTSFFIIIGLILILKDETGILYNIFYLPFHILNAKTKNGKDIIIISKKENLTGYIKVFQLNNKVFKEWN